MISAATLELLMNAGLSGEALLCVVRSIEADTKPTPAEILVARKREADRLRMADSRATVALQSRDTDEPTVPSSPPASPPSSLSPTPPITTTPSSPLSSSSNIQQNAREPSKPSVSRGTRLPADFVPLPNILEMARNRGLSEFDLTDEIEKFRDWANAATGQVSIKRDWQAALRNWLKRAADDRKKSSGPQKPSSKPNSLRDSVQQAEDYIARRGQESGEDDLLLLPGLREGSA